MLRRVLGLFTKNLRDPASAPLPRQGGHYDVALSATVFKVELGVSDVDHGYYADHTLTVARHPSETDERMVVRLLAFGLRAHRLSDVDGELAFGAGPVHPRRTGLAAPRLHGPGPGGGQRRPAPRKRPRARRPPGR